MTISRKQIAIYLPLLLFGGILVSMLLGFWSTTSLKIPTTYKSGAFAGNYDPQDIRGSYEITRVSELYDISLEDLQEAFQIPDNKIDGLKAKDLSTLSTSEYEVGPKTLRYFVAFYKGLPIEFDDSVYFSKTASDVIKEKGSPTSEQIQFLEKHTY